MEHIHVQIAPKGARWRRWDRKGWSAFASMHRSVSIGVLAVGMSILLLATQGASAQTADTTAVLRTLQIREVGVTGSQTAPTRNAQSHTPLFDRKVQAAAPVQTLESALRLTPSVDVRERGGRGAQADIYVRGGSFDQTMILLNGIDFTDARTGHQSHSLPVDLDCISGIELIDGVPGVGAAGYVIFNSDSSEAELFLPEETVVLDKRVRSNNEPVWNVEDDDTYQLEFNNDVLLVSRRGTLLYSSCGYGNMINAVFVDENGKEINAVFHNSENIVELTVDGMNYILKGYITASGYGYACPAYDLRGKGREAVLTNRYDNSSMKLHEK